mgnify:CR=1 FL=1
MNPVNGNFSVLINDLDGSGDLTRFERVSVDVDDLDSYDLIVALSPAAQRRALEYTRFYSLEVEYWQTMDPSGFGDSREAKINQYRKVRDQISNRIKERFEGV